MIRENTLVACSWHSMDFCQKPKNAIGIIKEEIPRRRRKGKVLFTVELLYPEEVAHQWLRIWEDDIIPLLDDVAEDEIQYRLPEAVLNLAQMIDNQQREIEFLKQTSGLQFQGAS